MSDKMREEFEEAYSDYCAKHGWKTYTAFHMLSEVYVKASTELAWNMWQASRESLVVELRDAYRKGWDASGEGHNAEYPGNRHELECWNKKRDEDLGLRVKP